MADQSFPQIPATVWWGIRALLQKTPRAKFDESMLSAQLSVQPAAARQYLAELRKVGLLDDDGKGTELANDWRMDDTYSNAVEKMARESYPEGLLSIAPPGEADRQRVTNWFMTQGLGEGSARNKAASYLLITSPTPGEAPSSNGRQELQGGSVARRPAKPTRAQPTDTATPPTAARENRGEEKRDSDLLPLNVNVQIHISADASSDQIDSIFAAMRKYRIG